MYTYFSLWSGLMVEPGLNNACTSSSEGGRGEESHDITASFLIEPIQWPRSYPDLFTPASITCRTNDTGERETCHMQ